MFRMNFIRFFVHSASFSDQPRNSTSLPCIGQDRGCVVSARYGSLFVKFLFYFGKTNICEYNILYKEGGGVGGSAPIEKKPKMYLWLEILVPPPLASLTHFCPPHVQMSELFT